MLSPEPVKKRRGDGQQLQNMNRNPVHKYTNTQNIHKIVTNTKAVQKLKMIQTHDNRIIIVIIIVTNTHTHTHTHTHTNAHSHTHNANS